MGASWMQQYHSTVVDMLLYVAAERLKQRLIFIFFCVFLSIKWPFGKDPTFKKSDTGDIFPLSRCLDLKWLSVSFMSSLLLFLRPPPPYVFLLNPWHFEIPSSKYESLSRTETQPPEDDTEPTVIHLCRGMKRKDYISFKCFFPSLFLVFSWWINSLACFLTW